MSANSQSLRFFFESENELKLYNLEACRYPKFDAVFCYEDVETVLWLLILKLALNSDYRGGRGAAGQDPTEKKPLRYRV